MLGEAMEQISMRLGQTPGALMSASFGNMVRFRKHPPEKTQ